MTTKFGWMLTVGGLLLLIVRGESDLLAILLPVSLLIAVAGMFALSGKYSLTGIQKR